MIQATLQPVITVISTLAYNTWDYDICESKSLSTLAEWLHFHALNAGMEWHDL